MKAPEAALLPKGRVIDMKKIISGVCAAAIAASCVCGYIFIFKKTDTTDPVAAKEVTVRRGNVTAGVTETAAVNVETIEQSFDLVLDSVSISASVESSSKSSDNASGTSSGKSSKSSAGTSSTTTGVSSKTESASLELVVDKVNVTPGQTVTQGDVLMTITQQSIGNARTQLKNAVENAELALKQAQIDESKTKLSAKYEYDTRVAQGRNAQAVYNAALSEIAQNISSLSSQINELTSQISSTTDTRQLSQLKTQLESLRSQLSSAQSTRAADELAAKQKYDEACMYYKNAQDLYNAAISGVGNATEQAKQALESAKSDLAEFEKNVGGGQILAAHSGTVTAVGYTSGDTITSDTPIASFADASSITVTVNVTEDDISVVELDAKVDISFLSFPDEVYEGCVTQIGSAVQTAKSTTVSYPVTVVLTTAPARLLSGMTANVTFISKKVENVLYVTNKAVITEGAQSYVLRKDPDGNEEKLSVNVGFSNGSVTEISGVSEGDTLLIKGKVS